MPELFGTARELARAIVSRGLSPVEAVESSLARLDATAPRLRSFVTVLADRALRDAKLMPSFGYAAPDAEVCAIAEAAVRAFNELGCVVEEVDAPLGPDSAAMWTAEFYAGVAARLAPTLRERRELLDPEVATRSSRP